MSDINMSDFLNKKIMYFDHASATIPLPDVCEKYAYNSRSFFYNQEAGHYGGFALRKALTVCGERLCNALLPQETSNRAVFFCNSATEAFNIICAFSVIQQSSIATDHLEHPALLSNLEQQKNIINWLNVDKNGKIQRSTIGTSSCIFIHSVQSELGVCQDTDILLPKTNMNGIIRVIDAVQSAGKMLLPVNNDIIVISGIKFGAPGGAALLINTKWKFFDSFFRHLHDYRHIKYKIGRVGFALAASLADAAEWWQCNRATTYKRISQYNHFLREQFRTIGLKCTIKENDSSPYILHLLLPSEYQSAIIVRSLSEYNILTSAGAACSSESKKPSPVLLALGYSKKTAFAGLRLSFGYSTTEEEVTALPIYLQKAIKNF